VAPARPDLLASCGPGRGHPRPAASARCCRRRWFSVSSGHRGTLARGYGPILSASCHGPGRASADRASPGPAGPRLPGNPDRTSAASPPSPFLLKGDVSTVRGKPKSIARRASVIVNGSSSWSRCVMSHRRCTGRDIRRSGRPSITIGPGQRSRRSGCSGRGEASRVSPALMLPYFRPVIRHQSRRRGARRCRSGLVRRGTSRGRISRCAVTEAAIAFDHVRDALR